MKQSREWMRRRKGLPPGNANVAAGLKQIPDNSEPWLPNGVRSVADALWISDRVKEDMERWKIKTQTPT